MSIHSYTEAAAHIAGGRNKTSRKVANNTYAEIRDEHTIAIRLHNTDILTYHDDGDVELNSGGWLTVTTKSRLNDFTPRGVRVHSQTGKRGGGSRWVVTFDGPGDEGWRNRSEAAIYADGMRLHFNGEVWTATNAVDKAKIAKEDAANAKMNGRITRYAALYTKERLAELVEAARANGMSGDCWFCVMKTEDGVPLGDQTGDHDHLIQHMKDKYVMLSLALNAMVGKGYDQSRAINPILYGMDDMVREAIREYLRARLYTGGVTTRHGRRPTNQPRVLSSGF